MNLNIISNKGYEFRVPNFLKNFDDKPPKLMNANNDCINKIGGCKFNTSSDKKIYIIGDSHVVSTCMI